MERYANNNRNSGVSSYQIGSDYIWVGFNSGSVYEYTYASAGSSNIETMKSYAVSGSGLGGFINRHVKNNYSRKIS